MVTLYDPTTDSTCLPSTWGDDIEIDRKGWKISGLQLAESYNGVAFFQLALYKTLDQWADRWDKTLLEIDYILRVLVNIHALAPLILPC